MRNKIIITLVSLAVLTAAMPVLAIDKSENLDRSINSKPLKTMVTPSNQVSGSSDEDAENSTDKKNRELRRQNIRKLVENQKTLLERLTERFDDIMGMIKSRRDKLEAEGADVKTVDKLIAHANAQKKDAETLLATAQAKAEAIKTAEDPKAAALDFLKATKQLRTKLGDLQKTLRQISTELKKLTASLKPGGHADESEQKKAAPKTETGTSNTQTQGDDNENE